MKFRRTPKRRRSHANYGTLEKRQVLTTFADAPLFTGTNQSDQVEVRYVDEHTVDIQINDTLHAGIDSTEGIRINLGRESTDPSVPVFVGLTAGDNVVIDQRISDPILLSEAEGITVLGDDGNVVQTS